MSTSDDTGDRLTIQQAAGIIRAWERELRIIRNELVRIMEWSWGRPELGMKAVFLGAYDQASACDALRAKLMGLARHIEGIDKEAWEDSAE